MTPTPISTRARSGLLLPVTVVAAAVEAAVGVLQLTRTDAAAPVHDGPTHVVLTLVAMLLAFGSTASNVAGSDPAYFPPLAAVANVAMLVSVVAFVVLALRRHALPVWTAVALPVYFLGIIPLSQVGGGLLLAAVLVAVLWALTVVPVAAGRAGR